MASNTSELLPILKALREYIVKEYGVNYPPHVRGEDASGKDLPSDWVDKLEPISGGDTVGRSQHGSQGTKSSRSGSQGTDPYIHKSELEAMLKDFAKHFVDGKDVQAGAPRGGGMHGSNGYGYPGEDERIPQGRGLAMDHHEEMEEGEEEIEDVNGEEEMDMGGPVDEDDFLDDEEDEDEIMAGIEYWWHRSQIYSAAYLINNKPLIESKYTENIAQDSLRDLLRMQSEVKESFAEKGIKVGIDAKPKDIWMVIRTTAQNIHNNVRGIH